MNYDSLKTFIVLAETRNFTRTAEQLYCSQPTITARLRTLEEELGALLFERTNKRMELTAAGKHFFPQALHLYREMGNCVLQMKNFQQKRPFVFAAPGTAWDYGPLRGSVIEYCQQHTDIQFDLVRRLSIETLSALASNEIDIGLVYALPGAAEIECVPYVQEDLLLVAAKPCRIVDLEKDGPGEGLAAAPPLIRPTYADVIAQIVEENLDFLPLGDISCDHPATYFELVRKGLGTGLLQRTLVDPALARGELFIVECEYSRHPMPYKNYLAFRKEKSAELRELVDHLLMGAAAFAAN